jgi:hypothetical protein
MEEINLLDKSVVHKIIYEMDKSEDKDRRIHAFDNWQVYSGSLGEYVEQDIKSKRPKSYEGYTIPNISISKMITDTVSKSYKEQPMRQVSDDASGQKGERLSDIYREADAYRQLQFLDTITNLHKYALLWVNWRDKEQRYQFWALQGYEFAVIRDKDTGDLQCVILNYGNNDITSSTRGNSDGMSDLIAEDQRDSSAEEETYAMWSKDHFVVIKKTKTKVNTAQGVVIKEDVTYVENPDNPSNINVIGKIPFVFLTKETSVDYPTRSPLFEQTITANSLMAEYLTASNIQGTGQLIVKYPEKYEGMFKKMTRGLMSAIKLPQSSDPDDSPTDVQYINPNPDLSGQREAIMTYIQAVFKEHGITAGSMLSGSESFNSGLERAIANASVDDLVQKNNELYADAERQAFEIIRSWEAFLGNKEFSMEDELLIKFQKPKVLVSDAETLANIEKRMQLGLMTKAEALMMLNPNLSEEEAEEKLEEIESEKLDNVKRFMSNGSTEADEEPDARPEQYSDDESEQS